VVVVGNGVSADAAPVGIDSDGASTVTGTGASVAGAGGASGACAAGAGAASADAVFWVPGARGEAATYCGEAAAGCGNSVSVAGASTNEGSEDAAATVAAASSLSALKSVSPCCGWSISSIASRLTSRVRGFHRVVDMKADAG
jgi:hypothetical protein